MLLILQNNWKKMTRYNRSVICIGCLLIISGFSYAQNIGGLDDVQIHGFVAQGVIDVNGSDFVSDDQGISLELTELGLNASYQFMSNIRFTGQAVYLNGGDRYSEGVRVDYLLADFSLFNTEHWQTNLYVGRFKNYHWLYSSTRDIPMTRPSIILPQSVYFDATRDLSVGGDGAALASRYTHNSIGELDFTASAGTSPLSNTQSSILMGSTSTGKLTHERDFQGSIYWTPAMSQWKFGIATTNADFTYDSGVNDRFIDGELALERFYANAEYQTEFWTLSAEILQEHTILKNILAPGFTDDRKGQGGYVQLQSSITPKFQFLARYEHFYANKNDKKGKLLERNTFGQVPDYFGFQYDTTLGFKYRIASKVELQFEHHWIHGTARLTPVLIPEPSISKEEYWQIWALQLMYWF